MSGPLTRCDVAPPREQVGVRLAMCHAFIDRPLHDEAT